MKARVFIGIPSHRGLRHECEEYLNRNVRQSQASKFWDAFIIFKLYEESLIQRARHTIAKEFLKSKADYLFFLDDDIVLFNDEAIEWLVRADKEIIGGAYICKKPPYNPSFFPLETNYPDLRKVSALQEVKYIASGCMLIRRDVVASLFKKYEYPFNPIIIDLGAPHNETLLSEDWTFCEYARRGGAKCFIHPRLTLGHLGTYAYSLNDFYNIIDNNSKP